MAPVGLPDVAGSSSASRRHKRKLRWTVGRRWWRWRRRCRCYVRGRRRGVNGHKCEGAKTRRGEGALRRMRKRAHMERGTGTKGLRAHILNGRKCKVAQAHRGADRLKGSHLQRGACAKGRRHKGAQAQRDPGVKRCRRKGTHAE